MSIKFSARQRNTISTILPEAFLDNEELAHLAQDLRFIDEEIEDSNQEAWIFSFAAMMCSLAGILILLYSLQNVVIKDAESEDDTSAIETAEYDKVVFENQNLQGDLTVAKSQLDELKATRAELENDVKTKSMKLRELETELKKLKSKK